MIEVFILSTVLLMSSGDIQTSSKSFSTRAACLERLAEQSALAEKSDEVTDGEMRCYPVRMKTGTGSL